jgi:xanthine/CO dehydrogenase XdhC/CoxF family maturation factor
MSVRHILQSFDAWRAAGEALVLATVYETQGSTYSKAGQRILIAANGDYRGLVSGGCLEGDLAERARAVVADDRPAAVTYDLRDAADEIFGLGVGCNGLLRVFLQPLVSGRHYEPFATLARYLVGLEAVAVATVIESSDAAVPPGVTVIARADSSDAFGCTGAAAERLAVNARHATALGGARFATEAGVSVLYAPLQPIPKLLVLGAGLDAIPLVGMAAELGWFVTVADHRPAYVQRGGFARAERALLVEPGELARSLPLADFDAIIVMSHHLLTDRTYLSQLAAAPARYLGVLGPRARRDRLLAELDAVAPGLRGRLKGPVGLDIGADSPEAIALSILAELHTTLSSAKR